MKTYPLILTAALACASLTPAADAAQAADDDAQLQRLALCQESWFDWKDDEARLARLGGFIRSRFTPPAPQGDGAFTPNAAMQVLGLPVTQVYPQSVGMGVGFSVALQADFAQARTVMEKQLGKPMACSDGDGMRACELKVGPKKTAVLMAPLNGSAKTSLMGCYYFYQQ